MAAIFVRPMRRLPARAAAAGQRGITLHKVEASFFVCVHPLPTDSCGQGLLLASLQDGTAYAGRQDSVKPPSCYTRQRNSHTVVGPSPARKGSKKTGDAVRGLILLL